MFLHNLKYTFKILLKNKSLIFWTAIWPILLGTMFSMAFSNLEESEKLSTIDIGVVDNTNFQENIPLSTTLEELSDKESDSYLFDITYTTKEEANRLLNDKEIEAYIIIEDETQVIVKENGINQTIIKSVIEEVNQYNSIATSVITQNYSETIYQNVMNKLNETKEYTKDISKNNLDYSVIEFYTLIAMACLFGAIIASFAISNSQANINKKGARVTISPSNKLIIVLSSLLASFIVQAISIAILMLYTIFVLDVDYGSNISLLILLVFMGTVAGLSLGLFTGTITVKKEATRTGITMAVTMFGCFLSGMMGITMKYVVDKAIPILNKINPSSMITDGLYALYYYESNSRFYFDILSLAIFSLILIIISVVILRRKKYDSI